MAVQYAEDFEELDRNSMPINENYFFLTQQNAILVCWPVSIFIVTLAAASQEDHRETVALDRSVWLVRDGVTPDPAMSHCLCERQNP